MNPIVFLIDVPGTPIAQGSKRHVGNGVMVESAKGLKDWRHAITKATRDELDDRPGLRIDGPVSVRLHFYVTRPKSHHVANDPTRPLKATAPALPTVKPDIDKTTRAVLDALTDAALWNDDAQVCHLEVWKHYTTGARPYAGVIVRAQAVTR